MMTFNREKIRRLSLGSVYDQHIVPIFHASCGRNNVIVKRASPFIELSGAR